MPDDLLLLYAPLSGIIYPLERVPDPVFAEKLVGDGISIDPTDASLLAPCAGEIMHLHPAGHAVTVRAMGGVEVLMHIGIDTVALKGVGFRPRVKVGDTVELGRPLIDFDLDQVAVSARSLLTQVVITNGEVVRSMERASGTVKAGTDILLKLVLVDGAVASAKAEGVTATSEAILIPNRTGLHARPAAGLAKATKSFQSEVKLQLGDRVANARSILSIMNLEASHGDKVIIVAKGPDAREAVAKLSRLRAEGVGGEGCVAVSVPTTTTVARRAEAATPRRSDDPNIW